jgi:hypothetical protein
MDGDAPLGVENLPSTTNIDGGCSFAPAITR